MILPNRIWTLMARKLNHEISADELQELEALLREHPEEHYAVEIVSEQWKQSPPKDSAALEKSFEKVWEKIHANQWNDEENQAESFFSLPKRKIYFKWRMAAAAIIVGVAGFWIYNLLQKSSNLQTSNIAANEITTKHGSKTKLLLPDSTQVWLNSGSKLVYGNDFGKTSREVQLSGEAYFDVAHNADKPFVIHTEKMDIKVLGTAFNVKCYPDDRKMETSLIRGSIEVVLKNRPAGKIILKPYEKLVLSDEVKGVPATVNHQPTKRNTGTLVAIQQMDSGATNKEIAETEWVQNKLAFSSERFDDLARRMERWYGVTMHFSDNQLLDNELTGTFENETVEEALKYLQLTTKFHYAINKNEITVFK